MHVIEGTWEEIERHKSEFAGHLLRLTIVPQKSSPARTSAKANTTLPEKVLRARGAFKGMFGGTEALFAEKQAEIELEERNF